MSHVTSRFAFLLILSLLISYKVPAAFSSAGETTYLLPLNCGELIPDYGPFLGFFESVASSVVLKDRAFSKRLFRILALREKLNEGGDSVRELNPIDSLVRKTLCFYREQKEPMKSVVFDDPEFVRFLRTSLRELEKKIEDAIYLVESDRLQRTEYERQMERTRNSVQNLQREATVEALRTYDRLSGIARRRLQVK